MFSRPCSISYVFIFEFGFISELDLYMLLKWKLIFLSVPRTKYHAREKMEVAKHIGSIPRDMQKLDNIYASLQYSHTKQCFWNLFMCSTCRVPKAKPVVANQREVTMLFEGIASWRWAPYTSEPPARAHTHTCASCNDLNDKQYTGDFPKAEETTFGFLIDVVQISEPQFQHHAYK